MAPTTTRSPSHFFDELSDDRLRYVAAELLDVRYDTLREMCSELDDNYTRESAVFGRSRNKLIQMALNESLPWINLAHAGMDVTFNIGRVPCRFFRDDPDSPEKLGFFKRNATDCLFSPDDQTPVLWRFIVERAMTDEAEDRVHFLGFNVYQEKIAEWTYRPSTPMLHSVDGGVPPATIIPAAEIGLRDEDEGQSGGTNTVSAL